MRSEYEVALLQTIREADPGDDDPRLVYADYLQDRGDPRGELIAIQCAFERAPSDELERRALNLFDADEPHWLGFWHGLAHRWRFRRGFLWHLTTSLSKFADTAPTILELDPFAAELIHLGSLELEPTPSAYAPVPEDDSRLVSAIAVIARLRLERLALSFAFTAETARQFAACPGLSHVVTLRFDRVRPRYPHYEGVISAFLRSGYLDCLHTLELTGGISDNEAAEIATERRFAQIRRLVVHQTLTNRGAIALVSANSAFTHLELRDNWQLTDEVLDELGRTRPPLIELNLRKTRISSADARALSQLVTLERLDVRGTLINDHALDSILALPELAVLNIAHTRITGAGIERLLRDARPTLRELTIATDGGITETLAAKLSDRFVLHRWR